jgi:hypothetical protein
MFAKTRALSKISFRYFAFGSGLPASKRRRRGYLERSRHLPPKRKHLRQKDIMACYRAAASMGLEAV